MPAAPLQAVDVCAPLFVLVDLTFEQRDRPHHRVERSAKLVAQAGNEPFQASHLFGGLLARRR